MTFKLGKLTENPEDRSISIEMIRKLTEGELKDFNSSLARIEELISRRRLVQFVEDNETDLRNHLQSTLEDLLHKSVSWNGVKRAENEFAFLQTNRFFLNYLSSMRTFLDHTEAFLKRKFGADSHETDTYKRMTSMFFDNSFAYRFFYKLRNYAQHVGLPIDSLSFTSQYGDREAVPMKITGTLDINFNRDKLLTGFKEWGPVRKHIEGQDEFFEVMPLISEMSHNIREIERNVEQILKAELTTATDFLTALTDQLRDNESEIFIAHNFRENESGDFLGYQSIHIPFHIIDELRHHFKRQEV